MAQEITDWASRNRALILLILCLGALAAVGAYYLGLTRAVRIAETASTNPSVPSVVNVTRQAFGAWSLDCGELSNRQSRCTLNMQVLNEDRDGLILLMVVTRDTAGTPVLMLSTPLGVTVADGVMLAAGEQANVRGEFQSCGLQRCRARIELNDAARSVLSATGKANLSFVGADGQLIDYNLPTTGFSEGFGAWERRAGAS